MIKTNIEYSGSVKIKLLKHNKIHTSYHIKNKGTPLMFQGIALALIQRPSKALLPNYIAVGSGINDYDYRLDSEIVRVAINESKVEANLSTENDVDGYKAIFKAIIPYTSVSENAVIREIGLFGENSGNNMLAKIKTDEPIEVLTGMSILIEWTTLIKNKGE